MNNIAKIRTEKNMTQMRLCMAVNILRGEREENKTDGYLHVPTLANIETGKTKGPGFQVMKDIAKVLGVTVDDLIGEEG